MEQSTRRPRRVVMRVVISKRFEVWVEKTIECESLSTAVELSKKMNICEFGITKKGVECIDSTELKGTGVREDW